jgi:hypothetical protein
VTTSTMQLDELVRTALTERRDLLEAIVKREVEALVSQLVDDQLNGNAAGMVLSRSSLPQEATEEPGQGSGSTQALADRKTCRVCGRQDVRFDPRRRVCRTCRGRQERERQTRRQAQAADGEEPHPATPQTGRKGQRRREQDDAWAERRRQLIAAARPGATVETINGRQYRVLRLEPQCAPAPSP